MHKFINANSEALHLVVKLTYDLFILFSNRRKKKSAELKKLFEIKLDFPLQKSVWRQVFQQRDTVQKKKSLRALMRVTRGKKCFCFSRMLLQMLLLS